LLATWHQQVSRLLAEEGDGFSRPHRHTHDGGRRTIDAARQVHRKHWRARGVDGLDHLACFSLDGPAESCAEQCVDNQGGPTDRLRRERKHRIFPPARRRGSIALQGLALAHQNDGNLAPLCSEFGCGHKAVAPVVAGSGHNQDRPLRHQVVGRLCDRLAGAEHQRKARRAGSHGQPIGSLHLSGGQDFHASHPMATL